MPDWFTYDWHFENQPARFAVDKAFLAMAPHPHMGVLFRLAFSAKESKSNFSAFEDLSANAVMRKCIKAISPLYVGRIENDTRRLHYFYGNSLMQLDELELIVDKARGIHCEVAAREESDWRTYLELLFPDAAKYQTEENRKYIELMRKNGDGIQPTRRIRLHMFFKTEPLMQLFAEKARLSGFAIGEPQYAPELSCAYGVTLLKVSSLNKPEVDAITTQAIRLAEKYEGVLQHWDCPLAPKINPLK